MVLNRFNDGLSWAIADLSLAFSGLNWDMRELICNSHDKPLRV